MSGAGGTCLCDHLESAHKDEPGFYDVRGHRAECGHVGCPCRRYEARQ